MTHEEVETFVRCMGKISDGWDARIVVGAYQHLTMDDAIHSFTQDLVNYSKDQEKQQAEKPVKCEARIQ